MKRNIILLALLSITTSTWTSDKGGCLQYAQAVFRFLCPETPFQPADVEQMRYKTCLCCVVGACCENWCYFCWTRNDKDAIKATPNTCCFSECNCCYTCCCDPKAQNDMPGEMPVVASTNPIIATTSQAPQMK